MKKIFETSTIIISLIIALVSLFISFVALRVSERTLIYSSRDYIPNIVYKINEDESIEILNKSTDLFSIKYINILKIRTLGFEDFQNKGIVQIPFITRSFLYRWIKEDDNERIIIKKSTPGPCAYICEYNNELIKKIQNRIDSLYSLNSNYGYALPSLQSNSYYIEIVYDNSFQERKSIIYEHAHIHGYGYDKQVISEQIFSKIIKDADIPKFESVDLLWDYATKRFFEPYDSIYKTSN